MGVDYRWKRHIFWLSCLGTLFSWEHPCRAGGETLVSLVRAGHRSARESIQTFSASVTHEVRWPRQPVLVISGKYWRSRDVVRVQEGAEDYLLEGSEIRQVGRGAKSENGQSRYTAGRRAGVETLCLLDVWSLMMIDSSGPNGGHYDLDRILEFAKSPPEACRETKDGHNCIRLTYSVVSTRGLEQHITAWHDVDRNYLIWKIVQTLKGDPSRFEGEILEFAEPLPGVFVPMKCHRGWSRGDEPMSVEDITLADVRVNAPIPKSVFQLPAIPRGTILDDRIQGTKYPVDEHWQPIGPAVLSPQVVIGGGGRSGTESAYRSQSRAEAIPLGRWLLLGSLVVLIGACVCLLYRHYRARRVLSSPN